MAIDYIIFLPILSAISAGTADFLYKKAQSEGVEAGSFYFAHAAVFAFVVAIFTLVTSHLRGNWSTFLFSGICAALSFASFYAMLLSLKQGEAGITITLIRLSFVITALLAISLLNEAFTISKVLGLAAAVSVVGLYSHQSLRSGTSLSRRTLWLALLAMIALGVRSFVYKVALLNGIDAPAMLLLQAIWVFLMTFALQPGTRMVRPRVTIKYAVLSASLQVTAVLLMLAALDISEASVAVPIGQMSFVVTALLAAWRLGEKMSSPKIVGTGCAIASVFLLGGRL